MQRGLRRKKLLKQEKNIFREKLNTEEGQRSVFRIATQLVKERQDVVRGNCLRNESGSKVVKSEMFRMRFKEYVEHLLKENVRDGILEGGTVESQRENTT